jgi:ribosomal protein L7/L12
MMVDIVDVVLVDAGLDKTGVIPALREVTIVETTIVNVVDLATAKRLTDTVPCVAVPNVPRDVGARVKASLEAAGATVELRLA